MRNDQKEVLVNIILEVKNPETIELFRRFFNDNEEEIRSEKED